MKQSKRMLSMILALIMCLSCFSVVANAASYKANVVTSSVAYDTHDDAILTYQQVATLACDMIDNLLEGTDLYDTIDAAVTEIDYDIRSIDNLGTTASGIKSLWNTLKGLAGDAKNLDVSELASLKRSSGSGDYAVFQHLFNFLGDSDHIALIKSALYGINTSNGLSLGSLIGLFLKDEDLADINKFLGDNLPVLVNGLVYDALLYGSYDFPTKWDDLTTKPANADTLDEIINTAFLGLMTDPQDFEYVGEGDAAVKTWDENSRILTPSQVTTYFTNEAGLASKLKISTNSILGIVDNVLQAAYEIFGVHGLNISLKQIIMDAMSIDFNELTYAELPADVQTAFGTAKFEAAYCSFAFEDNMVKGSDGEWYYTKVERRVVRPVTEEDDGTERIRTYYKADLTSGNALAEIMNWDYNFTASDFNFNTLVSEYGSIFGCLNHIVYVILNKGVGANVSAFNYGTDTYKSVSDLWVDGNNSNLQANLIRVLKAVLKSYTGLLFGKTHDYVSADGMTAKADFASIVTAGDLVDLVEYIGLPFFYDAMPQLVLPTANDATDYVFDDGVQILEFGAIVIREFLTDIAPNVNYDSYIFQSGSLTSADGRKMNGANDATAWINTILNMGMDLAYTLLNNQTNFNTAIPAVDVTAARWQGMADAIIMWAVNYVSYSGASIIDEFDPATIQKISGPLNKISYILNTLLPLGFINGCSTASYDFDVQYFFDNVLTPVFTSLDLNALFSLFGRNTGYNNTFKNAQGNILTKTNVGGVIIDLANSIVKLLLGQNLLVKGSGDTTINNAIQVANLQTTVGNLLNGLYSKYDQILKAGLPVAAKFVKGWGTENNVDYITFDDVDDTYVTDSANIYLTMDCAVEGLWRGYNGAKAEEMYSYKITDKYLVDLDGAKVTNFTCSTGYRAYPFCEDCTFTANDTIQYGSTTMFFRVTGTPNTTAKMLKAVVKYDVYKGSTKISSGCTGESKWFCIAKTVATGTQTNIFHQAHKYLTVTRDGYIDIFTPFYFNIEDLASAASKIAGTKAVNTNGNGSGNYRPSIGYSVGGGTKYGITVPARSESREGESTDYYFSVNASTLASSGVKSGDSASWTIDGFGDAKDGSNKLDTVGTISIYFYNGAQKNAVKALAKAELEAKRVSSMYTSDSWSTYYTALKDAALIAYAPVSTSFTRDYVTTLATLQAAIEGLVKSGTTPAVTAPTALLKAIDAADEAYGNKGYTDYKLSRWDRYKDVINDANDVKNLYNKATATIESNYWGYNSAVKASEVSSLATAAVGSANAKYINALISAYDAETIEKLTASKAAAAISFNNLRQAKVDDYTYRLPLEVARLSLRETAPDDGKAFLQTEINSANAQFTKQGDYTTRSWNRYTAALAAANAALTSNSNVEMFNAKYELLCARNALKTAAEEADYSQLEDLIKSANNALANRASYKNADADFSAIYAALGVKAVTNAAGDEVKLFPGAAIDVNAVSYAADDQKKVDKAADKLRVALAKLVFNDVTVTAKEEATVETKVIDAENEITATVGNIAQKVLASDVVGKLNVTGAEAVVSVNGTYAVTADNTPAYAGTGSSVTFYKTVGDVKVPVATVSIVVKGDVNGDGVIDVLDAVGVELVTNNFKSLSGLYFLAGDMAANSAIDANDLAAVVNAAIA